MARLVSLARFALSGFLILSAVRNAVAQPKITVSAANSNAIVSLPLLPHVEQFQLESSTNLSAGFLPFSAPISGWRFTDSLGAARKFYRLKVSEVSSNELLTGIVLNRLAYGPTPDELNRVRQNGPQAFIDEQLAPEKIAEDPALDAFTALHEGWEYFEITIPAHNPEIGLALDDGGAVYLDDLNLVKGARAGLGANLLRNGDFEQPLASEWQLDSVYRGTRIATNIVHTGRGALLLQREYWPAMVPEFVRQKLANVETNAIYTLSGWRFRRLNRPNFLVVRALGPDQFPHLNFDLRTRLEFGLASIDDLRAYHTLRAVKARRQFLEVMVQFCHNHFVTAHSKSGDYFGNYAFFNGAWTIYTTSVTPHFKELERWRAALLRPECTFQELLRISAESIAMICYLDTFRSVGGPGAVPNENYARELLELFTFGADNGYDQNDVTTMARVWTGWRINLVDPENEYNALAPKTTNVITEFLDEFPDAFQHYYGVFTVGFNPVVHDQGGKTLFPDKRVASRFGAPYAGKNYELTLPPRAGTNGVQDGYDVIAHLSNQPYTQEFISVKLCRLFIHDNFNTGYDFTAAELSPEAQLVRDCMFAWENSAPRGQIRKVLDVIFRSDLFRAKAASQKVKTPLEFVISSIRALRTEIAPGQFSADTDGYSLHAPLDRMAHMILFDREQPDGFPEAAGPILSVSEILERQRFVAALLTPFTDMRPQDAGASYADPVAVLKKFLPPVQWNDAGVIASFFLSYFYPAGGKASLEMQHTLAVRHLNTSDDGTQPSPFADLPVNSAAYDTRVRATVALLLSLVNFNEQ
jgi:uncharacterized protein (DUF1800 family)